MRKNINKGNIIIEKIEKFELQYDRLPFSLQEIHCDYEYGKLYFYYVIDTISNSYRLEGTYEHWYNKKNKKDSIMIMSSETIIYDSRKEKWIHEE